jgi:calcineurin-like phosphoesterase family protein
VNTWFTTDTHFGHAKIIIHSKRPFTSAEEMDETMIERWNKLVRANDDIWHLGDFNYRSKLTTEQYLRRLNGRIHLVYGNHDDRDAKRYAHLFASVQEVKYLRLFEEKITLYHYAQRVWRNSHHGAWHLFGHSHGSLPRYHRSMDVGVDVHNFSPVSFEEIRAYMITQEIVHHHPELVTDPWVNKDPSDDK